MSELRPALSWKDALLRISELEALLKRRTEALESISKNTCCGKCQEAALWAKQALKDDGNGE